MRVLRTGGERHNESEHRPAPVRTPGMRFALTLLAAFSLTGCIALEFGSADRFRTDFHYTFDLKPGGRVSVDSFNGGVELIGWDENKVEVSGEKYASTEAVRDQIRIETRNEPDMVELRTVKPSNRFGNMGARFTIHLPRTAVVERVTTSNGSIRVKDVASAGHLTTSNSSIRAENFTGGVNARTSNGSIEVDSVHGELVLNTSNGRIRADNVEGRCEAGSSNNSVTLSFSRPPSEDVHAHTSNGSITVHLPASSNARLVADTSNGAVRSDFDLADREEDRKSHLRGVLGRGGPSIELKTSNGGIHVARGLGDGE